MEKRKRKKNLGLLSFGEEAGEEDAEAEKVQDVHLKSAFDAAEDDPR